VGYLKGEAAPCLKGLGPKLDSDTKTSEKGVVQTLIMNYFLLEKSPANLIKSAQTLKRRMGIKEWLVAWRMVKRMKMGTMEVIHQLHSHIACLFNRKRRTILEFGYAGIKETVSVTGNIHNRDIAQ
jgi:hypothetical protein